jgi:hypothetical protein
LQRQRILYSAYRADQYADGEGYMTQLGMVFEQYPDEVVIWVTDPRTGVQRSSKWPPSISEVVEACDNRSAYLARLERYVNLPKPTLAPPLPEFPEDYCADMRERLATLRGAPSFRVEWATTFAPANLPQYPALVEWSKTTSERNFRFGTESGRLGIWINWNAWERRAVG